MRIFLIILLLISSPLVAGASKDVQLFKGGDKVALLVGINNYDQKNSGFSRLEYTTKDINQVAATLHVQKYAVRKLTNHQANKNFVLETLKNAVQTLRGGEGTFIFMFSGHGYSVNGQNYLATYDASSKNLQKSGLSISEITKVIKDSGIKRAVLFIDACRNDPTPGRKSIVKGFMNHNPGEGIRVLYSTRNNGFSWESPKLGHGVFSYFLNDALRGSAAVNNAVDFSGLSRYVEQKVKRWTYLNMSETQQPFHATVGDSYGDFVLAGDIRHRMRNIPRDTFEDEAMPEAARSKNEAFETPAQKRQRQIYLQQEKRNEQIQATRARQAAIRNAELRKKSLIKEQQRERIKAKNKQIRERLEHERKKKLRIIKENKMRQERMNKINNAKRKQLRKNQKAAWEREKKLRLRYQK